MRLPAAHAVLFVVCVNCDTLCQLTWRHLLFVSEKESEREPTKKKQEVCTGGIELTATIIVVFFWRHCPYFVILLIQTVSSKQNKNRIVSLFGMNGNFLRHLLHFQTSFYSFSYCHVHKVSHTSFNRWPINKKRKFCKFMHREHDCYYCRFRSINIKFCNIYLHVYGKLVKQNRNNL